VKRLRRRADHEHGQEKDARLRSWIRLHFSDDSDGATAQAIILCNIARFARNVICRARSKLQRFPICRVSNTDQLFLHDGLMMILETSTSSLFQVL
jgi:hypothetical protein